MSITSVRKAADADLSCIARMASLATPAPPVLPAGPREWLLVAVRGGNPVGSIRVRLAIGLFTARYWFHVGCRVHAAPELSLFHQQRTLLLNNDHTGAAELTDLFWSATLSPSDQRSVAKMLVAAALLLLGREHAKPKPDVAGNRLIVELPGIRDAEGHSPFWNGFGKYFYRGDPLAAARRLGPTWKTHVAALLPRDPLLASFISSRAQAMIGEILPQALPYASVLVQEGLRYNNYICIDDAGPVYECNLDVTPGAIATRRTVLHSRADESLHDVVLARSEGQEVDMVRAVASSGQLGLTAQQIEALRLEPGEEVWTRAV